MNPNKHGMNNNGPQIYRLSNRNPNKHGVNNNGPQNTTHKSTDWATATPINTGEQQWSTKHHTNLHIDQQEPQ